MKIVVLFFMFFGVAAFAKDKKETKEEPLPLSASLTEATIGLDCDSQVPGSSCPVKYSSQIGLLSDTNPRNTSTEKNPKDGAK